MNKHLTATGTIDPQRCDGCGKCVQICPARIIALDKGKAYFCGNDCMICDHCAASCPVQAIRIEALDPKSTEYETFETDHDWLAHGDFDTSQLLRLMRSRRSCRCYTDKTIDRRTLSDLVKIGITAPSGTNSQKWSFTVLPDRQAVLNLGELVARFFKKMNRLAKNPCLRWGLRAVGRKQLSWYYHEYYETVKEALQEWENGQVDRLFHGATAVIIVGSKDGASCPAEDAMLATQNILLAAHSMGLGSCLIGFAVEAMLNDQSILAHIQIPTDEKIYAAIALGYPNETYQRAVGRKKACIRFVDTLSI